MTKIGKMILNLLSVFIEKKRFHGYSFFKERGGGVRYFAASLGPGSNITSWLEAI